MRLSEEIAFVLEVIFDNKLVQFARFLEQGLAPLCGHGDRGRDLVAGCHVNDLRLVQPAADDHAILIDRLGYDPCLPELQQLPHPGVAGLFHHHADLLVGQQLRQQKQGILLAQRDQDLVGPGIDAAPGQHLGPNFLYQ